PFMSLRKIPAVTGGLFATANCAGATKTESAIFNDMETYPISPSGTRTVMIESVQLNTCATVLAKETELLPFVVPKCLPISSTTVPAGPNEGRNDLSSGT